MKTLLQAFNEAEEHLLKQRVRSVKSDGGCSCAYRGYKGTKCAVGALIADEHYSEDLEDLSSRTEGVQLALEHSGYPVDDRALDLYRSLQRIHDTDQPYDWENRLLDLREEFFGKRSVGGRP